MDQQTGSISADRGSGDNPERKLISELVGFSVRVIRPGDAITMDFRTDRVNFDLDEQDRIRRVWFG